MLAAPLQRIHCLSPFPYHGSRMDPNYMRIDLSYVGGKLRPKRHRPIQTPVPAFLRCTQNRSAFAREPLTQPTREVWDRQRAIGGFPMTRDEENREILIGVALFLTFVVLLVLYRQFLA